MGSSQHHEAVKSVSNDLGVTIVDVRINAAGFRQATEESIFTRMRTEREVQATRLGNEGQRQTLTIHADVDPQVAIILAETERDANPYFEGREKRRPYGSRCSVRNGPRVLRVSPKSTSL